jgi:uncharacterized protein YjbI with pentapeptide repeats
VLVVLCVLFISLLLESLFVLPQYLVDRAIAQRATQPPPTIGERLKAENDIRTTLLQGLGALVVLAGAVTTWRQLLATLDRNRKELSLSQEGQVTERFTRAIDQLGSETLDLRLGGIYALERIAKDSSRDRGPIMEVLTAFVRERAPWKDDQPPNGGGQSQKPAGDIQAILTVLGRRVIDEKWREPSEKKWREWREPSLDLSNTDLRGALFFKAHLEGADLSGAHLEGAYLIEAHLEGAHLRGARLEKAHLAEVHLEGADLGGAHLEGADLFFVNLEGAFLIRAHLEKARFIGAHLEKAGLFEAHLEGARLRGARLEGADLSGAHLEKANLHGARLEGANLSGAHLEEAYIPEAHLEGARNLTKEQIASAYTKWEQRYKDLEQWAADEGLTEISERQPPR